ncbi:MAG: hypothetical protein ACE5JA_03405 [bacterium]
MVKRQSWLPEVEYRVLQRPILTLLVAGLPGTRGGRLCRPPYASVGHGRRRPEKEDEQRA